MSVDITRLTAHLSPEQQDEVKRAYRRRHENSTAAFLWCFFFGTLGAHRFYMKQWGAGFLRLLVPLIAAVVIVAGIELKLQVALVIAVVIALLLIALLWEIIDLFRIDHEIYERNLKLAEQLTASALLANKSIERRADTKMEDLMVQSRAEAATGAETERRDVAADVASAVPAVTAAVAEPEALTGGAPEMEVAGVEEARSSTAVAAASDTYVERDVTEISDDPNATRHAVRYAAGPQNDWSATEIIHAEGEQERTAEDEGIETLREPGELGAAGVALGTAAVAGYALDEAITRAHSETDHSTSDSLETHTTLSAAEAERTDETVATSAAADAPTWPDYPPVVFDEPATPAPVMSSFDVTDTTEVTGAVKPIADIEPEASPLILALGAAAGATAFDASKAPSAGAEEALLEPVGAYATDVYVAPAVAASDAGDEVPLLLVPVESLDEPVFDTTPVVEPSADVEIGVVPDQSYIPPTVPVLTGEPAEPVAAEPEVAEPVAAEPERTGETLAELAAFAGAAGAGVAAVDMLAHRYDEPETAPAAVAEPVAPMTEEPVTAPLPEPAPVVAAAAAGAQAAATEAAEPPRRRLRRIREYLQVKRDGQVIEELIAEEIAAVEEDPEPIRQRLRDQLHRQAIERGLE